MLPTWKITHIINAIERAVAWSYEKNAKAMAIARLRLAWSFGSAARRRRAKEEIEHREAERFSLELNEPRERARMFRQFSGLVAVGLL